MRTTEKTKSIFSRKLIELRNLHRLTQSELAEKLNIERYRVAYFETKAKNPTSETLQLMADFFKVSTDYFLSENSDTKPGPESQLEIRMKRLKALPQSQQQTVIAMIDGVLSRFE